jgi:hypothetical protein
MWDLLWKAQTIFVFFLGKSSKGDTNSEHLRKFPCFSKNKSSNLHLISFLGKLVCVLATVLMILHKRCRQLSRNLSRDARHWIKQKHWAQIPSRGRAALKPHKIPQNWGRGGGRGGGNQNKNYIIPSLALPGRANKFENKFDAPQCTY